MKKLFIILFMFLLLTGCSSSKEPSIKEVDLKGYWLQTEENWGGDITDLTDNPYSYIYLTEDRLYFYNVNLENPGYYESASEKYYILEGNQLYYDYYELTGEDWKKNISEFGGTFEVSLEEKTLILTEYYDKNFDGFKRNTYEKMPDDFVLLEP